MSTALLMTSKLLGVFVKPGLGLFAGPKPKEVDAILEIVVERFFKRGFRFFISIERFEHSRKIASVPPRPQFVAPGVVARALSLIHI